MLFAVDSFVQSILGAKIFNTAIREDMITHLPWILRPLVTVQPLSGKWFEGEGVRSDAQGLGS